MKFSFKAKIYKTGINWCVDVPARISQQMIAKKGYIRIKGQINNFDFKQTLVPVKNGPYRLFVNGIMMKGGKTAVEKTANFKIEHNNTEEINEYPMPALLLEQLKKNKLLPAFGKLTISRRKDILKYLSYIKTEATLLKNIDKVIAGLKRKEVNLRIP
jgi:hypothetical protein